MVKSPRRLILLPSVLAIALSACGGDGAPPARAAAAVTVVTLKTAPVTLTRELPGRTSPYLVAEVRPQVSGIVKRRLFEEGGLVTAGQPLYQLDDAALRADASSANAQLARALATLESARLTAARIAQLAKIDAVSKQDNENAIAALRQAEADVGVARAALQGINVTLDYARITAPISGHIGMSSVTRGALVTANQAQPLATVQQLDPIHVDLTQSASELLELRRSMAAGTVEQADLPVTILLQDGTPYPHAGTLAFSEVTVDPSTGSFALRVVVPNPDMMLMPGMYVRAVIASGIRQNAILVPQQGITRDPKGNATALVVAEDGNAAVRQVQVGRTIGSQWLVEGGLEAGDQVIISGLQKVKPGAPVQATEAAPAVATKPGAGTPAAAKSAQAARAQDNPDAAEPAVPAADASGQ